MSTSQAKPRADFLEYRLTVGMTSMEGRGFYYPVDTAISKDGRLYVVSRTLESQFRGVRVTMCDIDGEYFGVFGSYGEADGQFIWPSCGAVDSRGRVYITDEYLCRISVFDVSGEFLAKWGTFGKKEGEFDTPSGIVCDHEDNLYVSDSYNHRIQKFTSDGTYLLNFGSTGNSEGRLNLPWGVNIDASGDIYVADWGNDRIQKFSPDGQHLTTYGSSGGEDGQFNRPAGVAVDGDGYIYVCDWGNERVQVLDAAGGFVMKLRGEATLSTWAENFLKINVEEAAARSMSNLEPQINYFVDNPHEESSHIEKYFWSPTSAKLDGAGNIFITESNRHRIQVYKRRA